MRPTSSPHPENPPTHGLHHQKGTTMVATTPAPDARKKATRKKIVASTAVLAGVAAVAGMGAFAVFTDSDSTTANVDAGQLGIVLSEDYTVSDIAPGDTIQRPVTISLPDNLNDGDLVRAIDLSAAANTETEILGTDDPALDGPGESLVTGTNGLNYQLQTCNGGTWAAPETTPAGPYTCSGTTVATASGKLSTIDTATPAELTPADFGFPAGTATFPSDAGDVNLNTLLVLQLPPAADNDYENAAAAITFTGEAIQRDGIQK